MAGCGDDTTNNTYITDTCEEVGETISPYQRVAVIAGTWDDVPDIADKIAQYVTLTDEDTVLGFTSGGWIIGGAKTANNGGSEIYEFKDLLPIPANGLVSSPGKSRVIEFCNGKYAGMAMATGLRHGPALPCEVSVHSDGTNIYIDMLDADAIFSIFFQDISDPDGLLKQVASDVKSELRTMVLAALDDATVVAASNADLNTSIIAEAANLTDTVVYVESTDALGPKFSASDLSESISYRDPYIVYKYNSGTTVFTKTDASNLAKDIITALGTDTNTADKTTGLQGLSAGSAWRSGREAPLAIPGIFVAEACSPKYAAKATALGNEYITALPCEIAVYVDDMDDTNQTIAISFLNPNFMFGTMFEGAIPAALGDGTIDKAGAIEYSTLADVVFADLRMIVDRAIQTPVPNDQFGHVLDIK
jgi:uncharacterized protein (DUF302 family)